MKQLAKKWDLSACLWSGYALFLLLWAFLLWNKFPAMMDCIEYVFPEKWFNVESFQKGLLPLWNPYIACGTPHLASFQPAPFYPLFWSWNLTGLTHAFFPMALAHSFLSALGFYLWLRALKLSKETALFGALSWSGSAYLTLLWGFPTHLASLTWLPWIFAASERLKGGFTWGRWFVLVGLWCLQVLAGYPIFSFYGALFWSLYLLFTVPKLSKSAPVFFSAFLTALTISIAQWLPFMDLLGYMHREVPGSNPYNLKWTEYLTLFWPDVLGTPGTPQYRGDYGNFIFGNFYLGLLPLLFLLCGMRRGKRGWDFWQKSLILTLFLPMGIHLVPGHALDPIIGKLEISKASFLFVFVALTLAAMSFEKLRASSSNKKMFRQWGWLLLVVWSVDLVSVPFRLIHQVPDPYADPQVKMAAEKIKVAAGEGRIVTIRTDQDAYSAAVTDFDGSARETVERTTQNTNVVWGIRSVQAHLTSVIDGYQNLSSYIREGYPYNSRLLDAAGVGLFLSTQPLTPFKYKVTEPLLGWNMIRNAGAMPNEWTVERQKIWPSRAACLGSLLDPKCFLENEVGFDLDGEGGATQLAPGEYLATFASDSPCDHLFQVQAGTATALVWNESFAPGWHAWVDGHPTVIQRADGDWMAVLCTPRVAHQVVFQYSPASARLGFFLALLALGGLLFLGLIKLPRAH